MPSEEDLSPEEKLLKVIQQGNPGNVPPPPRRVVAASPAMQTTATAGTVAPKTEPVSKPVAPAAAGMERGNIGAAVVEAKTAVPVSGRSSGDQRQAGKQAIAEAGEKKLTLPSKGAEAKSAPRSLGTVTAAVQPEALQSGIRARSRAGSGASLKIVNRGLGVAAVLLFVVVVFELFAARPVLPKPPENAGSPFKVMGAIVMPHPETNYLNQRSLIGDPLLANSTNRSPRDGVPGPSPLVQITNYLTENVKLEGVSISEEADQGFAAITEKGATRYVKIGGSMSVQVDGKPEKIILDRIQRETLIFLFGKEEILFKGAK